MVGIAAVAFTGFLLMLVILKFGGNSKFGIKGKSRGRWLARNAAQLVARSAVCGQMQHGWIHGYVRHETAGRPHSFVVSPLSFCIRPTRTSVDSGS